MKAFTIASAMALLAIAMAGHVEHIDNREDTKPKLPYPDPHHVESLPRDVPGIGMLHHGPVMNTDDTKRKVDEESELKMRMFCISQHLYSKMIEKQGLHIDTLSLTPEQKKICRTPSEDLYVPEQTVDKWLSATDKNSFLIDLAFALGELDKQQQIQDAAGKEGSVSKIIGTPESKPENEGKASEDPKTVESEDENLPGERIDSRPEHPAQPERLPAARSLDKRADIEGTIGGDQKEKDVKPVVQDPTEKGQKKEDAKVIVQDSTKEKPKVEKETSANDLAIEGVLDRNSPEYKMVKKIEDERDFLKGVDMDKKFWDEKKARSKARKKAKKKANAEKKKKQKEAEAKWKKEKEMEKKEKKIWELKEKLRHKEAIEKHRDDVARKEEKENKKMYEKLGEAYTHEKWQDKVVAEQKAKFQEKVRLKDKKERLRKIRKDKKADKAFAKLQREEWKKKMEEMQKKAEEMAIKKNKERKERQKKAKKEKKEKEKKEKELREKQKKEKKEKEQREKEISEKSEKVKREEKEEEEEKPYSGNAPLADSSEDGAHPADNMRMKMMRGRRAGKERFNFKAVPRY